MSWSRRHILTLGAAVSVLTACGFTPAYGPQGGAQRLQGRVALEDPQSRLDFQLAARLENRLGRASVPAYRLKTRINVAETGLGTSSSGLTTRYRLDGTVTIALTDLDGQSLYSGQTQAFTGYSTTGATTATLAAEQDAQDRLMIILADQIVDRLILIAADLPQ